MFFRKSLTLLFLLIFTLCSAQNQVFQYWNELGMNGSPFKGIEASLGLSSRWDDFGCDRIFPEGSIGAKINKEIKMSIDYRLISKRENVGEYNTNNRWNINLKYKTKVSKIKLGCRLRYQFATTNLSNNYDADFDQAWRFKPVIEYNKKKSRINYSVSFETFYNPQWGIDGRKVNKIRYAAGLEYNLKGPNQLEFAFLYDQYNTSSYRANRVAFKTAYIYELKIKKPSVSLKPNSIQSL